LFKFKLFHFLNWISVRFALTFNKKIKLAPIFYAMRPLFKIAGLCSGWIVWDACGTISFFTQIPAEMTRRLVRRGGFFD
jgi:hypothetical protein